MAQSLKLHSPAGSEPVYYNWPLVVTNSKDEASEIIESIRWVCEDFPELSVAFQNIILKEYDPSCYDSMSQLCNRYNKAIDSILQLWKGRAPPPKMFKRPGRELLRHIINICYSHAISDPEKLNIYEPFSPEVYGETSFDMVSQMIDEVNFGADDTFIDLGSGVGQVVLQVAASVTCKECYGIEKADTPAEFSIAMEKEFIRWMAWFGKTYSPFKLEKGDFLREETKQRLSETSIIFVNNFAFGPKVNHQLKLMFQGLKEGAKVVSSREYCPIVFKFNSRNLSELGAMMRVTEIKPRNQAESVSWTGKGVSYYLHVVDRTRLEKFFSILNKKKQGLPLNDDELSICSESNNSSCTFESGIEQEHDTERLEDNLDTLYLGATTRHQWQVLVSTLQASKKEHAEKKALDKEERKRLMSLKKSRKLMRNNKPPNLQGKLKKKIIEKYEKQKRIKEIFKETPQTVKSDSSRSKKKKNLLEERKREKKKTVSLDESKISKDLDSYFASMKSRYMKFIRRMNTKAYAEKIKLMVEYEMVRKRRLQKQVIKTEFEVKDLLQNGLQLFTKRIEEVGLAVKTPQDLLDKSKALSNKHKKLKDLVLNMETDVYFLEQKYKSTVEKREQTIARAGSLNLLDQELVESMDPADDVNLPNKLCGAIIDSLNHRKNLLQEFKDVKEQVEVLEKLSGPSAAEAKRKAGEDVDESSMPSASKKKKHDTDDKKSKPVAYVPPRMLFENGTIPPWSSDGKKKRPKKKKTSTLGSCPESVIQEGTRPFYPRYSYPPDPSMFYNHEYPWLMQQHPSQQPPFCSGEHAYSMYQSSEPCVPNSLSHGGYQKAEGKESKVDEAAIPKTSSAYSQSQEFTEYHKPSRGFLDATRSLLNASSHDLQQRSFPNFNQQVPGPRRDIINTNFPMNISSTQPFWQQYSNLAKATVAKNDSNGSPVETTSTSCKARSPSRSMVVTENKQTPNSESRCFHAEATSFPSRPSNQSIVKTKTWKIEGATSNCQPKTPKQNMVTKLSLSTPRPRSAPMPASLSAQMPASLSALMSESLSLQIPASLSASIRDSSIPSLQPIVFQNEPGLYSEILQSQTVPNSSSMSRVVHSEKQTSQSSAASRNSTVKAVQLQCQRKNANKKAAQSCGSASENNLSQVSVLSNLCNILKNNPKQSIENVTLHQLGKQIAARAGSNVKKIVLSDLKLPASSSKSSTTYLSPVSSGSYVMKSYAASSSPYIYHAPGSVASIMQIAPKSDAGRSSAYYVTSVTKPIAAKSLAPRPSVANLTPATAKNSTTAVVNIAAKSRSTTANVKQPMTVGRPMGIISKSGIINRNSANFITASANDKIVNHSPISEIVKPACLSGSLTVANDKSVAAHGNALSSNNNITTVNLPIAANTSANDNPNAANVIRTVANSTAKIANYQVANNNKVVPNSNLISAAKKMPYTAPPDWPVHSSVRISETPVLTKEHSTFQNWKIYKPGSASSPKSGRKSKSTPTRTNTKPAKNQSAVAAKVGMATSVSSSALPAHNENIIYRNPIMTILPSHSRILVVPNTTSTLSTTTTSCSTVFSINSQNGVRPSLPAHSSAVSNMQENTSNTLAAATSTCNVQSATTTTSSTVTTQI